MKNRQKALGLGFSVLSAAFVMLGTSAASTLQGEPKSGFRFGTRGVSGFVQFGNKNSKVKGHFQFGPRLGTPYVHKDIRPTFSPIKLQTVNLLSSTAITGLNRNTGRNQTVQVAYQKSGRALSQPKSQYAQRTLASRGIKHSLSLVELDQVPMREALKWWSESTGINMVANWQQLELAGVNPDEPVSLHLRGVPAAKILQLILGHSEEKINVHVTPWYVSLLTNDQLATTKVTRIYDVSSLIVPDINFTDAPTMELSITDVSGGGGAIDISTIQGGEGEFDSKEQRMEELADLIRSQIEPDAWAANGGDLASLRIYNNLFIIKAPQHMHSAMGVFR